MKRLNRQANGNLVNGTSLNPLLKIKNFRLSNIKWGYYKQFKQNDQLKEIVLKYIDILVITETKLDDTFPMPNFWFLDFPNHFALIGIGKGVEL